MLEALALVSRYQRDEEIYPQDGSVECWYRVISGAARRFALRADGRRQTVDLLLPGDFFGFGVHGTHAFTAEAIAADTTVERYPASRLERLAAGDPRTPGSCPGSSLAECRGCTHWSGSSAAPLPSRRSDLSCCTCRSASEVAWRIASRSRCHAMTCRLLGALGRDREPIPDRA
jgi:Cyclic nucleotide-binding domain